MDSTSAYFFQALHELLSPALNFRVRIRDPGEKADAPHADILLRAPVSGPSDCRTASKPNELPSPHLIAPMGSSCRWGKDIRFRHSSHGRAGPQYAGEREVSNGVIKRRACGLAGTAKVTLFSDVGPVEPAITLVEISRPYSGGLPIEIETVTAA